MLLVYVLLGLNSTYTLLYSLASYTCVLSRVWSVVGSNPTRGTSLFLGCAVLLCFVVCMTLLAKLCWPIHSVCVCRGGSGCMCDVCMCDVCVCVF